MAGENPSATIAALKAEISDDVSIGISGDGAAACGLVAGCDAWYSAIAGILPHLAEEIYGAARSQRLEIALQVLSMYQPLWDLFAACGGSARAIAAIAELKGLVDSPCLPEPLLSLSNYLQQRINEVMRLIHKGSKAVKNISLRTRRKHPQINTERPTEARM